MISVRNRRMLYGTPVLVVWLLGLASAQNLRRLDTDTLAVIGSKAITAEAFSRLYQEKLVRLGLTDNGETRQGYLRNLVDDEILIARARNKKLDRTKEAMAELSRIQLQELLNAYSEKHLSSSIDVTDEDLTDLFLKMNTKIKVRHLFARTKEEADSLYEELSGGANFSELAQRVFSDPRLKENGGLLGYISVDEMDPDFEKTAYTTPVGRIAKPIKTVQGYSILKVEDVRRNPLVRENDFQKVKSRLRSFERKRKYEEAAKQHTARLRSDLNIRFDTFLLSRLFAMTQQRSVQHLIENPSSSLSNDELRKVVVFSTIGNWTVRDLINALRKTAVRQRNWIHTRENFEDFIAGLVMRGYISEQARRENLHTAPQYRVKVDHTFDTFLLTTLEGQLKQRIVFSRDSVRLSYEHNRDRFLVPAEIRLSAILADTIILADSIRQMLERGTAFDEVAKRLSVQRLTAENGGDLGYFAKRTSVAWRGRRFL